MREDAEPQEQLFSVSWRYLIFPKTDGSVWNDLKITKAFSDVAWNCNRDSDLACGEFPLSSLVSAMGIEEYERYRLLWKNLD